MENVAEQTTSKDLVATTPLPAEASSSDDEVRDYDYETFPKNLKLGQSIPKIKVDHVPGQVEKKVIFCQTIIYNALYQNKHTRSMNLTRLRNLIVEDSKMNHQQHHEEKHKRQAYINRILATAFKTIDPVEIAIEEERLKGNYSKA